MENKNNINTFQGLAVSVILFLLSQSKKMCIWVFHKLTNGSSCCKKEGIRFEGTCLLYQKNEVYGECWWHEKQKILRNSSLSGYRYSVLGIIVKKHKTISLYLLFDVIIDDNKLATASFLVSEKGATLIESQIQEEGEQLKLGDYTIKWSKEEKAFLLDIINVYKKFGGQLTKPKKNVEYPEISRIMLENNEFMRVFSNSEK